MAVQREVVVITGSSGLIGAAVASRLHEQYDVIGFDRPGAPHPPAHIECIDLDVTSDDGVRHGLRRLRERHGDRVASVVHLAAYYDFSGEPSPLYDEVTVRGTERVLKELEGFDLGQFVFSSSMLVHAPCEKGERITEEWPLEPKWDYPQSKVDTERLIQRQRGATPAVLLRIAGVYTDDCEVPSLAYQIARIYERSVESRLFPGNLAHGQAFVHLDDVVEAIARVVERRATLPPEVTLLIGEPRTPSYEELQESLGRLIHGEPWETREIPKALAKTGAWLQDVLPGEEPFIKPWMIDLADDHYALEISRARDLLGWEPKHSLRETLPKMVAALKEDPARWYRENKLEGEPPAREEG